MKNNHEITLKQYAAYCKEQPLYLGTAGSYGMEMLTIIREGVWAEYDILAAFHPPVGAAVQVRVGANNQIGVPIEATAEKGMGKIVFAGYKEGVRQIAVDVLYKVAPSSGASGTEPAEPTPDVVQQILSAANGAVKTADGVREDMDKVLEAESKRAVAEQSRVKAETDRVTSETARKDAESKRANAEQERQTAEEGRVAAEAKRTEDFAKIKESLDEIPKIDDTAIITTSPWSSKQIVDTLCPPIEETGNPVVCYPVEGYPLDVTVSWGPTQEGSGEPSPDNVRPIKGRDGVTITRQEDNQVITLTLPETVYGGEVDAVSGEGIKNWKRIVFDGTEKWDVRAANYTSYSLVLPIRSKTGFCTHFKKILYDAIRPDTGTGETGCYLEFSLSAIFNVPFKNVTDWKNYLAAQYAAGTPVYIVYQYANEVNEPFAATGAQPIPALSGTNTLLTDADSVSVSGRADLIHIIRKIQEK